MITPTERTDDRKVTLEELLRVKRAERPDPEFWARFEHDLRAKQLAAIVEPRPWWIALRLPQAARVMGRFQVPMGAAAVLALTLVVVREYRPDSAPSSSDLTVAASVMAPATHAVETAAGSSVILAAADAPRPSATVPTGVTNLDGGARSVPAHALVAAATVPVATGSVAEDDTAGAGSLTAMIPWATQQGSDLVEAVPRTALGELPQVVFASSGSADSDHKFEGRVEVVPLVEKTSERVADIDERPAAVVTVAAAAPMTPVSLREARRSRILASLVVADNTSEAEGSTLSQVREVLVGSIDDDRSYDNVRRVGMGGDRLTLKF